MGSEFILRHMEKTDWDEVSSLIFNSTNQWYVQNGKSPIFSNEKATRLFCDVYESLDPGFCLLAIDKNKSSIAGSCFYHPRETHISLGIMNVHPDYFGFGIARKLLNFIIDFSQQKKLPLRLVSSAMNLDSFSLYTKCGFIPYGFYQDLIMNVPDKGIKIPDNLSQINIRQAKLDDIPQLKKIENKIHGIHREKDYEFFINNNQGIWHTSISEVKGKITGFLASVCHPGSTMLGPGFSYDWQSTVALIYSELNYLKGEKPVWLIPAGEHELVKAMYAMGAKNCELHVTQIFGKAPEVKGIVMPTFMPETG